MNRQERRHTKKIHARRLNTAYRTYKSAFNIALTMKKFSKGHLFSKNPKR